MGLKEKLTTAKPTTWPAEGIPEEEVRRIVENVKSWKYIEANIRLNDIAELEDNWNGHGAKAFSEGLINRCRKILNELVEEPFIAPTAGGSIQFEYEKENGDYLEFEIFENRIEMYSNTEEDGEIEEVWDGDDGMSWIKEIVERFYGK